jgi:chromosome partitioning protein
MEGTTVAGSQDGRPAVVVVGNEKGGTGKSTTAIHLTVALLKQGYRVATLDLDPRQRTLTRFIENRRRYAHETDTPLAFPSHTVTDPLEGADVSAVVVARARMSAVLQETAGHDVLVIDTPGSVSALSRAGHEIADVLITPLNDSLLDIDVLARVDWQDRKVLEPSVYSRFVTECRARRAGSGKEDLRWIVFRNRLAHIGSRNMRDIDALMELLAERIGFQVVHGFGERVVFRELFPRGLTLLDLPADGAPTGEPAPSHRAAEAELAALMEAVAPRQPVLA